MKKYVALIAVVLNVLTMGSTTAYAEYSRSACGYVFVHHDDGAWSVYQSGHYIETYSSGWSYSDIKEMYCSY